MNSDKFQTCPHCREIQVSTLALNCPKCGAPQDPATVSQKGKSYQKREWGSLENYIPCAACGAQKDPTDIIIWKLSALTVGTNAFQTLPTTVGSFSSYPYLVCAFGAFLASSQNDNKHVFHTHQLYSRVLLSRVL